MNLNKVVISGGGTGGHIFPAIAIADEIKRRNPNAEILFVGAVGKMEMEKVPAAGYRIEGLTIAGFQRKFTWSNFILPFKLLGSLWKARRILKKFKPQVVIGVGGYASGPTLQMATMLKIPTLVQEQNSFPGKTNKLLAKKVNAICTAYDGLEKFFPKEKIVLTGNPVRKEMVDIDGKRKDAFAFYGLDPELPTLLFIGGSLGARTMNQAVIHHLELCQQQNIQLLWQCGKLYADSLENELKDKALNGVKMLRFIDRMDYAYALADAIVSRAGAISVSELCLLGKPVILVPSPNVAEDHQTKNARALVENDAAILVKDTDALEILLPTAIELLRDEKRMKVLGENIHRLGKPNATIDIVNTIEKIIEKSA